MTQFWNRMLQTEIQFLKLSHFFISFNKKEFNLDKIQNIQHHTFKCPDEKSKPLM